MLMKCPFNLPLLLAVALGSALTLPAKSQEIPATAEATNTLTLAHAIELAQADNPEIRVLSADIASARGEVTTAKTWQNPEISVTPGFKTVRDQSDTQFHGDFGLEQTFAWPGKRALQQALAEKSVTVRQLALDGFRAQLAILVRRAFFTLLAAREEVTLREQRLTLAKTFVAAAQKKVEGGYAPEFEATKATVEVVAAQKALRGAQARHAAAQVALNALMGRNPTTPLALAGTLEDRLELPDLSSLLAQSLRQNPGLKIRVAEAERAGLNLQTIRQSRLPDFKVGPGLEYTRDEQIVGIGVTLPLPFWDQKKGEIATATACQAKALAELNQLRRDILSQVTTASLNLVAARESLTFYTPALRAQLQAALVAAEEGYAAGRTPLWLYLEAQRTCFDTQADYFDTLQNTFAAQAELESAVGLPLPQLSQPATETK